MAMQHFPLRRGGLNLTRKYNEMIQSPSTHYSQGGWPQGQGTLWPAPIPASVPWVTLLGTPVYPNNLEAKGSVSQCTEQEEQPLPILSLASSVPS